jgi:TetR/AcrR family transcriptional regulator, cholesterol catabolism regulator
VVETVPRRQAIESVASTLFRERGYAATSVRDIARALDIRGASLYAHVASKEDVLWAIVDRAATAFELSAATVLDGLSNASPRERLGALVRAHVRVIVSDPELAGVFVHEWRHLSEPRRKAILARRDAYERQFRAVIDDGVRTADFAAIDARLAATFILTALNGLATWYRRDGRVGAAELSDQYAELAVAAVTGTAGTHEVQPMEAAR